MLCSKLMYSLRRFTISWKMVANYSFAGCTLCPVRIFFEPYVYKTHDFNNPRHKHTDNLDAFPRINRARSNPRSGIPGRTLSIRKTFEQSGRVTGHRSTSARPDPGALPVRVKHSMITPVQITELTVRHPNHQFPGR